MSIEIVKEPILPTRKINDVLQLYRICNNHDDTDYVFDQDDDFRKKGDVNTFLLYEENRLSAVLNIFAPSPGEAEITGLTVPEHRKKGFFRLLLTEALDELERRKKTSILFVCDSRSEDGKAAVSHCRALYEYSEFLMEFSEDRRTWIAGIEGIGISEAAGEDKQTLAGICRTAFDMDEKEGEEMIDEFFGSSRRELYTIKLYERVVGMIGVYREPARSYIYGFCIDEKYRRRGIGKYVLSEVVRTAGQDGKKIVLEVQTDNRNALRAYEQVGFSVTAEFSYSRISSEELKKGNCAGSGSI